MTGMDAQSLLECWEHGRRRHPLDRALLLFAAAEPGADPETLADRTLGQRNAALLRLRQSLFGDAMKSCVACPHCGENLEFALSASSLLERATERGQGASADVHAAGHTLRLPTSRDLAAMAAERDQLGAARRLLQRLCVENAPAQWSADLESQISRAMDEADPCIDLALDLVCPACGHLWNAPFDVGAFLWEEIDVRARRLLDEVHALARSYSWSERQILELSETRRRAYLERVLA
jgi:hypothetical protein